MKPFALALLLLTAVPPCPAAVPDAAQADAVREAVFQTLFVRARMIMPEAKVFILEKETHHPPQWGNMNDFDPSAGVLQRFAGNVPPVVPVSQSGGGASMTEEWHEDRTHAHGPLLRIVSLHRLSDTSVEAETDIDAGLPRPAVSVPYTVTWTNGKWAVMEDNRTEWRQAVHEGDVREAVVRDEFARGVNGVKSDTTPCYLSFGAYTDTLRVDPPDTFLARFAGNSVRLQRASQCPGGRKPWMMLGVQHVRWISDTEAEVDGGGTSAHFVSAESDLYQVTQGTNGWDAELLVSFSA